MRAGARLADWAAMQFDQAMAEAPPAKDRAPRGWASRPSQWRLATRITLTVVALVIPVELIVLWSGLRSLDERRAAELDTAVLVGQALAAVVDGFAADLESTTLSMAVALGGQSGPLDQESAGEHLRLVAAQYPTLRAMFLTDPQGRVIATGTGGVLGFDLSSRPYIPPLQAGAETVWSGGIAGVQTGETTVAFGRAVRGTDGEQRGFLIAAFYPQQFVERLPIGLPTNARVTVVDERGAVLYDTDSGDGPVELPDSTTVRRSLSGEIVRIAGNAELGREDARFGALVPIPRLGWAVGYTLPHAAVETTLVRGSAMQAGGIALVIVVAASIFVLIARRLTRPLAMLAGAADAIAQGEQPSVPEVESTVEVQQLARSMRTMSDVVAEREERLRHSQQRLELALQAARMVAWEWDPARDRVTTSANLSEVYGVAEIAGTGQAFGMIHPDDLAAHQAAIRAAVESRGGYRSEFRIVRPDTGLTEWREERGLAVTDEHGKLRRLHGVVMDTTQRQIAEHALRESESRLRLAVEAAPVVLFNHDLELRYTWVGKTLAGLAPDVLLGKTDAELFSAEIAEAVTTLKRRALDGGERAGGEIDLPADAADTTSPLLRWALTAEPLRDPAGSVIGITCAALDVTERRALERMQQEFISLVSHELRNPLASVKGYAQLMQRRGELNERAIRSIVEQSDHLDRLISDLLDSSRAEAGRLELRRRRTTLIDVVTSGIERVQAQAEGHQLRLNVRDGQLVGIWDAQRLEQVLTNLLMNAVKYSPDGGEVVVSLERQGTEAHIAVSDQGVGIAPEQLPRVFDRFYRISETAPSIQGLGIGLYIAKELTEAHGGRIWAESPGLGQGTTMHLTLPLDIQGTARHGDSRPVLVVDDDESLRELIVATLRDEGYHIAIARDGLEALERVAADPPALILLDWMMPRLGGEGFATELRQRHPALDVPIVVMTAGGVARQRAASIGAVGFISKPFELVVLVDQVARHLGPRAADT